MGVGGGGGCQYHTGPCFKERKIAAEVLPRQVFLNKTGSGDRSRMFVCETERH